MELTLLYKYHQSLVPTNSNLSPPSTNMFSIATTNQIPLTPTKASDEVSEKLKGKSLSCFTKSTKQTTSCYKTGIDEKQNNMELVWHGEFSRLFTHFFPHQWLLRPTFSFPKGQKWMTFKDSAKVRFMCKTCGHGWTSMRGRVVFWFILDEHRCTGMVLFRLFGQRCQSCSPALFEHAMWYPEEVIKVIGNVFNRIGQEYYGFYSPAVRVDRRGGKPKAKHNSLLCQACSEGVCPGEFDDSLKDLAIKAAELEIIS